MVTFAVRPYQEASKAAVEREWLEGRSRTLLVLPTGCGKTIVFCQITEDLVRMGKRVLILAHRGELLDQAAQKMEAATGLRCSVEKADQTCLGEWFMVVVGSVQTLMRQTRLDKFDPGHFDAIIVDEAHHCLSDSYQRVLSYFDQADVLGVTATPDRGDMRDLGEYFDSLAYQYSMATAIQDGYLCPIKALHIPLEIDLSQVKQQSGDFQLAALGSALDPYLEQIATEMVQHCTGRKTVVFLPLIATSQKFCDILKSKGLTAREINGESQDRAEVLADFDAGHFDVLCNSMLLTEGWDCPTVDCVVVLRPTKIRSLYCQMVGRGTRLAPGKDHLLLLDFLWHTERHLLCHPATIVAESQEVAAQITANIAAEPNVPVDLMEADEVAQGDCVAERESKLAEKLREMKNRKRKLVDPLQFEISIQAEDLSGFVPAFGWEAGPVQEQQQQELEKAGIYADEIETAGKADKILERINQRRAENLSTPKQIRFLEKRGFQHVGQWPFGQARSMIDQIAGNGWRTPKHIQPASYKPEKAETTNG